MGVCRLSQCVVCGCIGSVLVDSVCGVTQRVSVDCALDGPMQNW